MRKGMRTLGVAGVLAIVCGSLFGLVVSARLAYLAPWAQSMAIYVMNDDGTNSRRLTSGPDMWASWSPDGTRIAFSRWEGGMPQLYVMDADGGNVLRIPTSLDEAADPKWSPDGERIAFATASGIRVIRVDGTDEHAFPGLPVDTGHMAWSPDGRSVAFDRVVDGQYRLFVLDVATGEIRSLGSANGFAPAWCPDGSLIAFCSARGLGVVRPDGAELRWLSGHRPDLNEFPSWSPDGTRIAYESDQLGYESVCALDVVSGEISRLADRGEYPVWCPVPQTAP